MSKNSYSDETFWKFVESAKQQANESGKTAYILVDKTGKLSIKTPKGTLKTTQKIVEEIYPDYHQ
jgi:hypothetical protein